MNALRLSALALVAAMFTTGSAVTAEAQSSRVTSLVEYEVVVDLRFQVWGSNGKTKSVDHSLILHQTSSRIEADDVAEAFYMLWMIDPEAAEDVIIDHLGGVPFYAFRIKGVSVRQVRNYEYERQSLLR